MTPALFQRTSSRFSLRRNSSADDLIVVKSFRSRLRNMRSPLEERCFDLSVSIVALAFSADLAAI